ncbi:MAG: FKBP-type peptidyl-prolyl cis-trans isomerase [Verrucomicrobia bacterium]|nr:FKBP-type peptidyl-prolyl cis-trans isomerase [Verrucomicrobiota bacterium]
MRSFFVLLLLGVILATIAIVVRSGMLARKNPGIPINAAMREAMAREGYEWSERDLQLIAQHYTGARDTKSGLRYLVRATGSGEATPKRGQLVTVNYAGRLLDGEKPFDASADHGGPFNFIVGQNTVIAGWDEALLAMHKGEKRTLLIPFWLAYGEKGIRGTIPPRATLVFDIELVDFR